MTHDVVCVHVCSCVKTVCVCVCVYVCVCVLVCGQQAWSTNGLKYVACLWYYYYYRRALRQKDYYYRLALRQRDSWGTNGLKCVVCVWCVCGVCVCDGYYRHASRQKVSCSTNGLKCVALALFLQPTCKLYCSLLPCVAVCSSVLHCVAACCSDRKMWSWHSSYSRHVLQRVAACCSVLQRVAACCMIERCRLGTSSAADIYVVMQCVAFFCNVLQYVAMCCNILQCVAACYSMLARARACCGVWQCVSVRCRVWRPVSAYLSSKTGSLKHAWMSSSTHMNEAYHKYEWDTSHVWMVVAHTWMSHDSHIKVLIWLTYYQLKLRCTTTSHSNERLVWHGVATMSRLLQKICLFCKRSL